MGVGGIVAVERAGLAAADATRGERIDRSPVREYAEPPVYVGLGIGVVLVPPCSGRHLQHILQANAIVGAALEHRCVAGDRVLDGSDGAFVNRDAHER